MQAVIRRARPEEASTLAHIHVSARRAAMPYLPKLHSRRGTEAWFQEVVLPRDEVYVVEADGRAVGLLALGADVLEQLYVLPDYQRRGIGSDLLALAKRLRPEGFRLYVFQRNEGARRFYEQHGLHLLELGDGSGNEEGEPDAVYVWRPGVRASPRRPSSRASGPVD